MTEQYPPHNSEGLLGAAEERFDRVRRMTGLFLGPLLFVPNPRMVKTGFIFDILGAGVIWVTVMLGSKLLEAGSLNAMP